MEPEELAPDLEGESDASREDEREPMVSLYRAGTPCRNLSGPPGKDRHGFRGRCKGKMAEYEIPKEILEWEGPWPMTVVGKMDFKALEKALEERLVGR